MTLNIKWDLIFYVITYIICFRIKKVLISFSAKAEATITSLPEETKKIHFTHTNWNHILDKGIKLNAPQSFSSKLVRSRKKHL